VRPLKAWDDETWKRKLSKTLTVSRVDENIPTKKMRSARKPWYLALTQQPETNVADIKGLPKGHTLLLSEDDVLALVRYLLEPQVVAWADNPERTEAGEGEHQARLFLQPGMVAILESEDSVVAVNGEAQWSPDYFTRQEPFDRREWRPTMKIHTLPWPWKLQR
jgi:hypothetical protein